MLVYNAQGMSRREQKSMAQIATVPANAHLENMLSRFFFAPNTAMPCVLHIFNQPPTFTTVVCARRSSVSK